MNTSATLPDLIPTIVTEEITMDQAQYWFQGALERLQRVPAGHIAASTFVSFISDSKALMSSNLALIYTHSQLLAQGAQLQSLQEQYQLAQDRLSLPLSQEVGVLGALQVARAQRYHGLTCKKCSFDVSWSL
jgi:hypothetical protein